MARTGSAVGELGSDKLARLKVHGKARIRQGNFHPMIMVHCYCHAHMDFEVGTELSEVLSRQTQCPKIPFWFGCRRGKLLRKKGARVENCHFRTYITHSGKHHFEKEHQCVSYRDKAKHYLCLLHDVLFFKSISVLLFKT